MCEAHGAIDRRHAIGMALAGVALLRTIPANAARSMPTEVAGIAIPRSAIALKAAGFSRDACPDYLFNHCMRTFVFGALTVKKQKLIYNADQAFVAATLHDLGLLPAFESANASFEIDGANRAEKLMLDAGMPATEADIVWHAVEMHDGKWALTKRQGPEAMLVAAGAASDVDGPDADTISAEQIKEAVAAFPRLQFKKQFTALLIGHCKRKPTSQQSTWLEGLCREQVPSAWTDTTEQEIAAAPFSE